MRTGGSKIDPIRPWTWADTKVRPTKIPSLLAFSRRKGITSFQNSPEMGFL